MKIVPEKVFVQANPEATNLTIVMEGYRLTLSKSESEALRDGLTAGLRQLDLTCPDARRTPFVAADNDARRAVPTQA